MRKPAIEPHMIATIELCERPWLGGETAVGAVPAAEDMLEAGVDDVVELVRGDDVMEEGVAVMVEEAEVVGMTEVKEVEEGIAEVEEMVVGVAELVGADVVGGVVVDAVVVGAVVAGAVVGAGDDRPPYTQSGPSGICGSVSSDRPKRCIRGHTLGP
jgi:hypothetical protein